MTTQPNTTELRRLLEAATKGVASFTHNARHEKSRVYIGDHVRALFDGRVLLNEVADAELYASMLNAADWLIRAAEERDALNAKLVEWCQDLDEHIDELESEGSTAEALARRAEKEDMQEFGLWREAPKAGEEPNQ